MSHIKTPTKRWRGYTAAHHRTPDLSREPEAPVLPEPRIPVEEQRRRHELRRLEREATRHRALEERSRQSLQQLRQSNAAERRARLERARKARAQQQATHTVFDDNVMDFDEVDDYRQDLDRERHYRQAQRRRQIQEQQEVQRQVMQQTQTQYWTNIVNQHRGRDPSPPARTL